MRALRAGRRPRARPAGRAANASETVRLLRRTDCTVLCGRGPTVTGNALVLCGRNRFNRCSARAEPSADLCEVERRGIRIRPAKTVCVSAGGLPCQRGGEWLTMNRVALTARAAADSFALDARRGQAAGRPGPPRSGTHLREGSHARHARRDEPRTGGCESESCLGHTHDAPDGRLQRALNIFNRMSQTP